MNMFLLFLFVTTHAYLPPVIHDQPQLDELKPITSQDMVDKFGQDLKIILEDRSRAHFDDLSLFMQPRIQIHSCFSPGKDLTKDELHHLMTYLSTYYQRLNNVTSTILSETANYVHGMFHYTAVGADQTEVEGKWAFTASLDEHKKHFVISYIVFSGDCQGIPKIEPKEPKESIESFMERIRVKLMSGLFLPDGVPQTEQDFEEFGDFISSDAEVSACEQERMSTNDFIKYMISRYHLIRKYKDNEFDYVTNNEDFAITFSTTWTAANTTEFTDTYIFRVKKKGDYFPELNEFLYHWKIYSVTKKCTLPSTPTFSDFSLQIQEVNKRFCEMLNGGIWDVFQSFLDLFDPNQTTWQTCEDSESRPFNTMREYLEKVGVRYAKCEVKKVDIRDAAADFLTTFVVHRANEVQEQEELTMNFGGVLNNSTGKWWMNKMNFVCNE